MAHTKLFKDNLKAKLTRKLKPFAVQEVDSDYEEIILSRSQIFWDFRVKLRQHDITILIEIESKQENPINNLIKTLIWLNESCPNDPIIFLHFFDTSYNEIETSAKDYCSKLIDFLNRDCKKNLIYAQYPIDELTKAAQAKKATSEGRAACLRIAEITHRVINMIIRQKYRRKK